MLNIAAGAPASTGYNLTRSLRFRASASAYLNRTPASATNRRTYTWSGWVKRGGLASDRIIFAADNGTVQTYIRFRNDTNAIQISYWNGSSYTFDLRTTATYRDPSAWYHIIVAIDTTQATSTNRVKLYVNGDQVTAFSTASYPSQNFDTEINNTRAHGIGAFAGGSTAEYFDGYLAEVNFIDGQALTPSSFGAFSPITGVWQPAKYQGTYGTNGFYLPFTDNSTAAALGTDFSGNSNTWTVNNISVTAGVTYDSMTDVPTLTSATAANFATGNPLSVGANTSLANGNLSGTLTGSGGWSATICGLTSGKWYYEATVTANAGQSMWVGFLSDVYTLNNNGWSFSTQTAMYANDGRNGNNAAYGATWTTNDIIGVALDLSSSSGSITFYKNGVSQGVMFSSLTSSARWRPLISGGGGGSTIQMNFGQRPFAYTPPTGFVALNAFNLPTATILKGNTVMDATLYTGTGASLSVTNAASFQPDLVWVKGRSGATDNAWYDSVRGVQKQLESNNTDAETTETTGLTAFGSGGFTVGALAQVNTNAATYDAWQWKGGGAAVSNTSGTITSQVSANANAGFSVVAYTGTGANATVGHGLGVAPSFIIVKKRNSADAWQVYHAANTANPETDYLVLNTAVATVDAANRWNDTAPTSSVFSLGNDVTVNESAATYVAYCWSEIAGFSKFGSYTGNGSADGPFVYTGFRARWILLKASTTVSGGNWVIIDTAVNTSNTTTLQLFANLSNSETSHVALIDILSNGFKVRTNFDTINSSGATMVYAAYAENPFKNSLGR
jgi:hypothetical protein